ncbi:MAG: ATP-dependent helicase, partial [Thermodesulfovibrionales bacterium]
YQDINPGQYRLLRLLSGEKGNLCAVGDADQAIYGFRGADLTNFLSFTTDFPGARTIQLGENYRSTATIVRASDSMIRSNRERVDKELVPTGAEGARITVISVPDERAEGEAIVRETEQRIGGTSHFVIDSGECSHASGSYAFSDFAVIYRTHSQARAIEEAFSQSGIPCRVLGGRGMAGQDAVADTLSVMRSIIHPGDDLSLRRTAQIMGLPEQSLSKTAKLAEAQGLTLREAMESLVGEEASIAGFIARRSKISDLVQGETAAEIIAVIGHDLGKGESQGISALLNLAVSYGNDISRFIAEAELLSPADDYNPRVDAVTLMTLHAAKGLEFRTVFITGCEDGLIPYTLGKECNEEEERRLFYVGMTRAKEELCLIHSRSRLIHGQRLTPQPSPFLKDIPGEFLNRTSIPDRIKKEKKETQMGLF